jgi:hypothetical protein
VLTAPRYVGDTVVDTDYSRANGWEPARANTGELMLLKHNYLDGWLQTYIVDLKERRLPEYADMCVIMMLCHAIKSLDAPVRGGNGVNDCMRAAQVSAPPVLATNAVHEGASGDNCNT